jgi:hypothetical protein
MPLCLFLLACLAITLASYRYLKDTSIKWQVLPNGNCYDWLNNYYALIDEKMEVKISYGGNDYYKKIVINVTLPNEKHYFYGQYSKRYGIKRFGEAIINNNKKNYPYELPPFFKQFLKLKIMFNLPGDVRRLMWKTFS